MSNEDAETKSKLDLNLYVLSTKYNTHNVTLVSDNIWLEKN